MMNTSIYNAKLIKHKTTGKLRIGCTDTFSIGEPLSQLIQNYHDKYPHIDLDLESYGFRTLKDLYNNGDLDLVLAPEFECDNYKNSSWSVFQHVDLCIAVPINHPLSNKDHLTMEDIKNQPMIAISPKESLLAVAKLKDYCRRFQFEANIVKYVSNLNSLILGVKNGIGITICDSSIQDPQIKKYPLEIQPNDSDIVVLWNKSSDHIELDLFLSDLNEYLSIQDSEA